MSDLELLEGIKNNDQAAFKYFVEKYQRLVYRVVFNIVNDSDDADDITQDVFIQVYRNILDFRADSKISTWMYRIATNKALNLLKKNRRKNLFQRIDSFFYNDDDMPVQIADELIKEPSSSIEQDELSVILRKAISSLPDNQKIAYSLHNIDDLAYNEICEVMNLSLSAAESLIHRAKKNLQKKLAEYYHS